ncbi:MAG TPA: 16S rRNA (guanine(966)-N(2))-methyltransferase RsmD [Geminicoccaceae bacterium]|nr:16S rRNA (guanine(966)-N(2))-methyltransferase RsmD [Geminicoccaceae bacterium]
MSRTSSRRYSQAMRIIAGSWRGRALLTPQDQAIRPTGDRAREALFSILEHGRPPVRGGRFLDLFCGTGAVGLEAASRGAAEVLLIDQQAAALALARANLTRLGAPPHVSLLAADAARLGPARCAYDLVFLDPPYRSGLAAPALAGLLDGWLAPEARVVVELAARDALEVPEGYALEQERRYGAARFVFLRAPA